MIHEFVVNLLPQSLRVSIGERKSEPDFMNQLIKSLPNVLRAAGNAEEVAAAAAIAAWKHAAGDGLKGHAVPVKLENRTLTVSVADAIWQKQLHAMRGQLLFRVNTILGQPIVNAIEFVIDANLATAHAEQQKQKEKPLENEVPLELWSAANAIHDKELRKSFLRAATVSLKRRKS